ncbi:Inactive phospholipase D5 [Camelus dromedarius]|uniref:Inactive phospholipase D5 n=1 Tax=Camelus dromedarius TaxID=9838 RepID=A0A5N4CJD6_CAMDR|nr:Inactive phospholipase D5 [Camelus dromedarius]
MKELGVIFYNCSCLVLDLQRIFALYSSLKFKSRVPQTWSKRLYGVYDNEKKLQLQLNETKSQAFVSNSPKLFCPKNRSFDIDAIYSVIDDAKQYVYIAVTDYLPISSTSTKRSKFFDLERENACVTKEHKNHTFPKLNRNKYMVTDGAAYIGRLGLNCLPSLPLSFAGNFDWVGNDFTQNAGTGLVINQADVRNSTSIIKQLKDVFERDWYSPYARTLQPTKQPNCSSLFKLRPPSNKTATYNASGKDPSHV